MTPGQTKFLDLKFLPKHIKPAEDGEHMKVSIPWSEAMKILSQVLPTLSSMHKEEDYAGKEYQDPVATGRNELREQILEELEND